MNRWTGLVFVGIAGAISVAFLILAYVRDLTALENTLLQITSLGLGLWGSYLMGKESAKEAARDLIKPHARSAFRRLISLYKSLSRLAYAIQTSRDSVAGNVQAIAVLDRLEAMVTEQIGTADDALEDWNDLVPDEISTLKTQLQTIKGPTA